MNKSPQDKCSGGDSPPPSVVAGVENRDVEIMIYITPLEVARGPPTSIATNNIAAAAD